MSVTAMGIFRFFVCLFLLALGNSSIHALEIGRDSVLSLGEHHTCAIDDTGVVCWGWNNYGQTDVPTLSNPTQVFSGNRFTCALDDTGVVCWGYNVNGQTDVPSLNNPTQVSSGSEYSCALDDTGVVCWGPNSYGRTDVPNLINPRQVSAGQIHTCALDDTGVVCWGSNHDGRTDVPSLSNPTQVSAGQRHTCALDDTGVVCWGYNHNGQTDVPSLSNPTQVSLGAHHTCALDDTGVVCWGWNEYGQATVPLLSNPTEVSLGFNHTCALDDSGVVCWARTHFGQANVPELTFTFDEDDTITVTDATKSQTVSVTLDYPFTGSPEIFITPQTVNSVVAELYGAQGNTPEYGGLGGSVKAKIPLESGDELFLYVGAAGYGHDESGLNGFNGGNKDGLNLSGGGASDIRVGGHSLTDRIAVAGGGGERGYYHGVGDFFGGAGGGLIGESGQNIDENITGGMGGTQSEGGLGGCGNIFCRHDGVLGVGGSEGEMNGHGGGGYYGGGGGGYSNSIRRGGGGGGSSYISPDLVEIENLQGVRAGDGFISITFELVDSDADGFPNECTGSCIDAGLIADNCPLIDNPNQLDTDGDSVGDVCDNDIDNDGIVNSEDPDSDNDGLNDDLEIHHGLNPLVANSVNQDFCNLPDNNLVAWWDGEGTTTDRVSELVGNPLRGWTDNYYINYDAIESIGFAEGKFGDAFSFSGDGDHLDFGPIQAFQPPNIDSITLSAWVYRKGPSSFHREANSHIIAGRAGLRGDGTSTHGGEFLVLTDDVAAFALNDSTGADIAVHAEGLMDNQWHHLVGIFDANTKVISIYANGLLIETKTANGYIPSNNTTWKIGASSHWSSLQAHNGYIDELQVFNKALTSSEVLSLTAGCYYLDNDSDGVLDYLDAFPDNANEHIDTDLDGIGDNADLDDDNDGFADTYEIANNLDPLVANLDIDNDGIANLLDADNDNDGSLDTYDAFPLDANEQIDSDADGVGDNADADNDNDGVINTLDLFPLDPNESADSDGDGVGDNADFFPNSAEYSLDSDLDQMPDAWERKYGLNPTDASDALLDQDNDGKTALEEYEAGTIPMKILDIDANGSFDALTDGLIILRYAFGLRGEALVNEATANDAMRNDAADVEAYIESLIR